VEGIELLDGFTKVTLTLCGCLPPIRLHSGLLGLFFAQFATTIATSTTSILLRGFIKPPSHPALRATLFSKAKEQHPYVLDLARMPGLGCFFWKEKTDNGER
jgi:multidrug efflux pump subunit AcrB